MNRFDGRPGPAESPEARTFAASRTGVGGPEGRSRMNEVEAA